MSQIKNTIKITIPFSFKGVEHSPSSVIDLDIFSQGEQAIDNVFHLVANENKIDNYSYEYEMLESATVVFSEPTGIASEFMSDNFFDLDGFKKQQEQGDALQKLQAIARDVLNIDDIESNKEIKNALLKAYQAGKES